MAVTFDLFTTLFSSFDAAVIGTIKTGTAAVVKLIVPLVGAGFSLYVMLVMLSYLRGSADHVLVDLFTRLLAWFLIILFGTNLTAYSTYVVPFVLGTPDQLVGAVSGTKTPVATLDALATKIVNGGIKLIGDASGAVDTLTAIVLVSILFFFALGFLAIAAGYLLLAKIALVVLLAIGPIFICMALFPATREMFRSWTGQCINYMLLGVLFGFLGSVMVSFMDSIFKGDVGVLAIAKMLSTAVIFILVALSMPSLAASLAGGVGISSNVGKLAPTVAAGMRGLSSLLKGGGGKGGGGSISGRR